MYKELIISSIIVIFIIIINIVTQNYTTECVTNMDNTLVILRQNMMEKEDGQKDEEIIKQMEDILKQWHEKYEKLTFYIEHDELEKVETELTMLNALIQKQDYSQGMANLDNSRFILEHIKNKFTLEIKNIF